MNDREHRSPDWRRATDYSFTRHLGGAQWAWEFLRRNPDYRREWQEFRVVWQDLEAVYGRPPNRDFCAWKQDPRAWVRVSDETAGDCRVDEDKVLIECAFGARWGFHKFPPDPADNDPVGENRLTWRETEGCLEPLGPGDAGRLGVDPALVAVGFDLRRDLRGQLEQAKRLLQTEQRRRIRAGEIVRLTVAGSAAHWQLLLRVLDAVDAGAGFEEMRRMLGIEAPRDLLSEAIRLRDEGYRELVDLR